ncbi:DUF2147 domain-containing protein [Chryseobacterium gambrini]|uniref:DUF2147 domain-containing protein n=1 Tax=Chryseobacterium gambrini TaxID=373672 RepID=A0AAJ1R1F5_9FLAO|nr:MULTISPECIES: DUF2147 domain-containing protein [Chryseobacterium]MDN4011803.1 DUF2147 domain-containing protein [Chryseobacterium gambrini]MDN4029492.1 DUF2147 domain-containing protein [Chryseobacterium gambrini]QWA40703.1 DUF2147 domain-containing protein [Chryseobacterium sp. ZHDP1]
MKAKTFYLKFLTLFLVVFASFLNAQNKTDITGQWESDNDDRFRLEFFKVGNSYEARMLAGSKIVESDGRTSKKDTKNPNPQLRSRNLVGVVSLKGLIWKNDEFINGNMYNPQDGKTYTCKAWIENNKLYLRGYLGISILGKTITFHKYK